MDADNDTVSYSRACEKFFNRGDGIVMVQLAETPEIASIEAFKKLMNRFPGQQPSGDKPMNLKERSVTAFVRNLEDGTDYHSIQYNGVGLGTNISSSTIEELLKQTAL